MVEVSTCSNTLHLFSPAVTHRHSQNPGEVLGPGTFMLKSPDLPDQPPTGRYGTASEPSPVPDPLLETKRAN
jgi:hypothetical protein